MPIGFDKIKSIKDAIKINEVEVNLENEKFDGNVLDIGMDNHGIIYQMCKNYDDELCVDYVDKEGEQHSIEKNEYDVAVLFLAIGKLSFNTERKKLLQEVYDYLKDDGEIKVWDIDKGSMETVNLRLKVLLPGGRVKSINFRDFNFVKDSSKENIIKLIEPMFDIIETTTVNNIYCIRGRKIKKEMT